MKTGHAVAAGLVVGGAIGYLLIRDARLQRLYELARQNGAPVRLPEPGYFVHLPTTQPEFATLDAMLCACRDSDPDAADPIDAMVRCASAKLYPDFPWPPIAGDHHTVNELWLTLHTLSARALAMGACPAAPMTTTQRLA